MKRTCGDRGKQEGRLEHANHIQGARKVLVDIGGSVHMWRNVTGWAVGALSGGGCCLLSDEPILKFGQENPVLVITSPIPPKFFLTVWTKSKKPRNQVTGTFSGEPFQNNSINPFVGSTGQYFVLQNDFWFLGLGLWLSHKHFSFMITLFSEGNAWSAVLKLFAFSSITSVSGMPENRNTVYLVNCLN